MEKLSCRACGLLYCYNEELILRDNLTYYLNEGIDLVIFDNGSTDSSLFIINEFLQAQEKFPGKIIDVIKIETRGFEWIKILRSSCEYMHRHLFHYDWLLIIDSDSLYYSPVKNMPLLEFMAVAQKYGYNVIDGRLFEFYPTEKDDANIVSAAERLCYGKDKTEELLFVHLKYHRLFHYHPKVEFYTNFGHIVNRQRRRVLNKVRFIYKHYPWVSFEHGVKKIFQDRKPRYVERATKPILHPQWMGMLPIEKDFIKRSEDLSLYTESRMLISRRRFFWLMECGLCADILGPIFIWLHFFKPIQILKRLPSSARRAYAIIKQVINAFPYTGIVRNAAKLKREIKKDVQSLKKENRAKVGPLTDGFLETAKIKLMSYGSTVLQYPVAFGFPAGYHFLMTNFCNAGCIFCNQPDMPEARKEITLLMFKTMASHIPPGSAKVFYFTGGGEPLLCRDLIPIIRYTNKTFPAVDVHIRTNGLLIANYAQELSELNISELEISIHGTEEVNNRIIQRDLTKQIFDGITVLNRHLRAKTKRIDTVFCCALSRTNIETLPDLIRKAAGLGVRRIETTFVRFYPGFETRPDKDGLQKNDSLYFHKELYNDIIKMSKKLARKLGVYFEHEPLFFKQQGEKPCIQPWRIVLVDWEGDIYPCTGGEVWFEKEVKSKKYFFGNLLNEQIYQLWTNESYVRLRRTVNQLRKENFIPECTNCHNTICFKGSDSWQGHILTKGNPAPTIP
ncbi:MAG: radical SAM protein [Candidatus Omnitrophota bacterium]